jgi:hypothetical protein
MKCVANIKKTNVISQKKCKRFCSTHITKNTCTLNTLKLKAYYFTLRIFWSYKSVFFVSNKMIFSFFLSVKVINRYFFVRVPVFLRLDIWLWYWIPQRPKFKSFKITFISIRCPCINVKFYWYFLKKIWRNKRRSKSNYFKLIRNKISTK